MWRWRKDFAEFGLAGLIDTKRGPKSQRLVTEEIASYIKELRLGGRTIQSIADELGISTCPVRQALGLLGPKPKVSAAIDESDTGDLDETDTEGDEIEPAGAIDESTDDIENDSFVEAELSSGTELSETELSSGTELSSETVLLPIPLPEPRTKERVLARFGLLGSATPVFTQGAGLARLGSLLILPTLALSWQSVEPAIGIESAVG